MASLSRTLYIGVTNDLVRRVREHKMKELRGFTASYNITRLVWFEEFATPSDAIAYDKSLKNWRRDKKIQLMESVNPSWDDLSAGGRNRNRNLRIALASSNSRCPRRGSRGSSTPAASARNDTKKMGRDHETGS